MNLGERLQYFSGTLAYFENIKTLIIDKLEI
jgi:hypothetical protein